MPENTAPLPDFTRWPSFPFEGDMRVKRLAAPVEVEPPRSGEDAGECVACNTPDDAYVWVSERWRVRAMDRPSGLPMVLILECRSHLDLGDLPNLLAAELGVMTVRMERAIRSLDDVARVHVNRWGDGSAHLHMWFLARPYGLLQLRGTFLSLWDDILPVIPESQWRENLALVAAWLAEFGGQANAEPAHIQWQSPSTISVDLSMENSTELNGSASDEGGSTAETPPPWRPTSLSDVEGSSDGISPSNGRKAPTVTGSASVASAEAAMNAEAEGGADAAAPHTPMTASPSTAGLSPGGPATVTGTASVGSAAPATGTAAVGTGARSTGTATGTATVVTQEDLAEENATVPEEAIAGRGSSVPRPSPAGDDLV